MEDYQRLLAHGYTPGLIGTIAALALYRGLDFAIGKTAEAMQPEVRESVCPIIRGAVVYVLHRDRALLN